MLVPLPQFGASHFVVVSMESLSKPSHRRNDPGQSVPAATHVPDPVQVISAPHETGLPHCPHASHVCTLLPEHFLLPGVHAGDDGQEQAPHAHVGPHVSVPYVLHGCVAPCAHGPCPLHAPFCQTPPAPHVCVSVPQLPHDTGLVWPGEQLPTHAPPEQVELTHATGAPHMPPLHVCTPLPEHCVSPLVHDPVHTPPEQVPLAHATGLPTWPHASHVATPPEAHCVCPGVHVGAAGHEQAPQVHVAVHVCEP
jgi:hypothetical protein